MLTVSFAYMQDLQLDYECLDTDLKEVADTLHKDWKAIAKLLGLDKNDISKIEDKGDKNAFAGIISHWKRRRNDTLTFNGLMTTLCESTEYSGKQDYLDGIMRPILGTHITALYVGFYKRVTIVPVCICLSITMKNVFARIRKRVVCQRLYFSDPLCTYLQYCKHTHAFYRLYILLVCDNVCVIAYLLKFIIIIILMLGYYALSAKSFRYLLLNFNANFTNT